jgi:hypothetical protein
MNDADTVGFMAAQIAIANWYLDRALQACDDTSSRSRYLHYARQAHEIVMRLLPNAILDETSQRVHQELSVLRQRLQVAENGGGKSQRDGDALECTAG